MYRENKQHSKIRYWIPRYMVLLWQNTVVLYSIKKYGNTRKAPDQVPHTAHIPGTYQVPIKISYYKYISEVRRISPQCRSLCPPSTRERPRSPAAARGARHRRCCYRTERSGPRHAYTRYNNSTSTIRLFSFAPATWYKCNNRITDELALDRHVTILYCIVVRVWHYLLFSAS